jgi:DNA-binding CsgD family transcriptional regulator
VRAFLGRSACPASSSKEVHAPVAAASPAPSPRSRPSTQRWRPIALGGSFLLKDVTLEHLVAAVQLVQAGDALLAPSITRRLVELFAPGPRPSSAAAPGSPGRPGRDLSALTPREVEVLGLIARGLSNAELAAALTLSEAMVKTHVARILTKLDLRDRVQAVVFAYETGLVAPRSPTTREGLRGA